jgi:hypothetical protein
MDTVWIVTWQMDSRNGILLGEGEEEEEEGRDAAGTVKLLICRTAQSVAGSVPTSVAGISTPSFVVRRN